MEYCGPSLPSPSLSRKPEWPDGPVWLTDVNADEGEARQE